MILNLSLASLKLLLSEMVLSFCLRLDNSVLSIMKLLGKDEGGECQGSVTNKGTAEIAC